MVLVSHDHKFIFIKTKKTAGTSFEMMLEPYCAPPGHVVEHSAQELVTDHGIVGARNIGRMKSGEKPFWNSHLHAKAIKRNLGGPKWRRYLKLTAVRNPFSRAISQFYWQRFVAKDPASQDLDENRAAFRDWVFSDDFTNDYRTVHVNDTFAIDDAFRLEHMDEDIPRIGARLGVGLTRADLPHVKDNASFKPDIDLHALFTPEVTEEVVRRMAWVFDNYGYSTDPMEARL